MKKIINWLIACCTAALLLYSLGLNAQTLSNSPPAGTAGPLIRVEGGEHSFLIPQGYFRSRVPGYASKDSWWLEALWPDLTPWHENNAADDKEFHAPGGGRMIKMDIKFSPSDKTKFLNRLVGEYEPGDLRSTDDSSPDGTLQKRIKGDSKHGLQSYYMDFDRLLVFLNRNRSTPIVALDDATKFRFKDWFVQRDSRHNISTLIRCSSQEIPDPPEASITGKKIVRVPQCEHMILLPRYNADVSIRYRRVFLPQWRSIEDAVRGLLIQFETTRP